MQEKALEQLKLTEGKTVAVGQKMDLVFHTLRIGFFSMDYKLVATSIEKAKMYAQSNVFVLPFIFYHNWYLLEGFYLCSLFEAGGDWERKNRLKVYEGLYCMATRNFKKAAELFLDSISTFTTYELFPYDTFIFYTVLTSIISLDRVSLKQKVGICFFFVYCTYVCMSLPIRLTSYLEKIRCEGSWFENCPLHVHAFYFCYYTYLS